MRLLKRHVGFVILRWHACIVIGFLICLFILVAGDAVKEETIPSEQSHTPSDFFLGGNC